jgi:hypothetical protein
VGVECLRFGALAARAWKDLPTTRMGKHMELLDDSLSWVWARHHNELVRQATLPPPVLLLRLQTQRLGHRRDFARLPDQPVLVPGPRESQPSRGGVPGVGAPVRDGGKHRRPTRPRRAGDRVLRHAGGGVLEAQLAVGEADGENRGPLSVDYSPCDPYSIGVTSLTTP